MFFRLYILIEFNAFNQYNIIGIYNHDEAHNVKNYLSKENHNITYKIEGPYTYNVDMSLKPTLNLPKSNTLPEITSSNNNNLFPKPPLRPNSSNIFPKSKRFRDNMDIV